MSSLEEDEKEPCRFCRDNPVYEGKCLMHMDRWQLKEWNELR